jgi:hypothetical protein
LIIDAHDHGRPKIVTRVVALAFLKRFPCYVLEFGRFCSYLGVLMRSRSLLSLGRWYLEAPDFSVHAGDAYPEELCRIGGAPVSDLERLNDVGPPGSLEKLVQGLEAVGLDALRGHFLKESAQEHMKRPNPKARMSQGWQRFWA